MCGKPEVLDRPRQPRAILMMAPRPHPHLGRPSSCRTCALRLDDVVEAGENLWIPQSFRRRGGCALRLAATTASIDARYRFSSIAVSSASGVAAAEITSTNCPDVTSVPRGISTNSLPTPRVPGARTSTPPTFTLVTVAR
jgi:hypothetical protein